MSNKLKQDISIGGNLRALRNRVHLTQEEVAARLQVLGIPISREVISQMELGHYSIRVSVLLALKDIYHASYDDFFKGLSIKP